MLIYDIKSVLQEYATVIRSLVPFSSFKPSLHWQSQAGYHDETNVSLHTSEKASNYHHYLENVFSKRREFEQTTAAIE